MRKSEITRKEEKLEKEMIEGLETQGFYAAKTSDRFKAGKPDLRIGHRDWAQIDAELKYNDWPIESLEAADLIDSGMTKLQWLKIKERNEHGMPSVCLIYFEALDCFHLTTLLRCTLPPADKRGLVKLPKPKVIDGGQLFIAVMERLYDDGYKFPGSGRWGAHNWNAKTKHRLGSR